MSQINVANLTFGYDGASENVFENTSFALDTNWKLGLVGRNGCGKTTFLRLLRGELEYKGTISASVDFEYFPYKTDVEQFTIDVIREISPLAEDWEIYRELSLLDIDDDVLYRQFFTLSKGEQTKAMLAGLFLRENAFLLIDEPTNHLDVKGREKVAEYLNKKKGYILVSHDRDFLDECIDHVLSINRANIDIQKGNFSTWYHNKQLQDGFELAENDKLKSQIKHLEKAAKRTEGWSDKVESTKMGTRNSGLRPDRGYIGRKAAKMMSRSRAISQRQGAAVEEKSKLLKNLEETDELKLSPLKFHTSRLVQLQNVSVSYGDKLVCENVSFAVEQSQRIALRGANGCGKSTILKLICGELPEYTGKVIKSDRLVISYVPQDTSHLLGTLDDYCEALGIDVSLFKAILRKLDFSREQFEKPMEGFSGGQKKKVLIAGSLCQQAHLYIWDEPLNFIDVLSRMQIEALIEKYQPTLLFVEHDHAFCESVATQIIEL